MKKNYIVPESKLIVINLKESIAISGGVDAVEGTSSIRFTSQQDGCRDFYTGILSVTATGTTYKHYYEDFRAQVNNNTSSLEHLTAWFTCYNDGF